MTEAVVAARLVGRAGRIALRDALALGAEKAGAAQRFAVARGDRNRSRGRGRDATKDDAARDDAEPVHLRDEGVPSRRTDPVVDDAGERLRVAIAPRAERPITFDRDLRYLGVARSGVGRDHLERTSSRQRRERGATRLVEDRLGATACRDDEDNSGDGTSARDRSHGGWISRAPMRRQSAPRPKDGKKIAPRGGASRLALARRMRTFSARGPDSH